MIRIDCTGVLKTAEVDVPPQDVEQRAGLLLERIIRNGATHPVGCLVADERAGMNLNFDACAIGINSSSLVPIATVRQDVEQRAG